MADFKTALEALADGKLELEVLGKHLDKLLRSNPRYAGKMLSQLDKVYDQRRISDGTYAVLKRQINQYRRAHAEATEGGGSGGGDAEATVYAREDAPAGAPPAPEDSGGVLDITGGGGGGAGEDAATELDSSISEVDFDISMTDTHTGAPSVTAATGPVGTEWQPPQPGGYQPGHELGVGDVIKDRFKLLDVLGVGGMGKVFKGVDLLKEEARDKNPYMAVKLLNEDFKSHPEAFISLQRESSRQQKLAHPNIATVYDFDRIGGPGTPVFITMELMEGQPLNTYIKKVVRKQGGLPFTEAFAIVKQLAAALEYAHERRLVHSDFKPGNAFLCNDGTVKTLDFGIARAVKNPVTGEAEKTLFDPGKLGALTPAYASLEMLEGEEPDTRDDTYALGCVAYELLTGKHPFNKLPANTAKENGLVPAPVKGIPNKSNRALRRALAFHRKDRSPTVTHFIEEFEGKATWHKNPVTIAAAVLLVLGAIAYMPVTNYLHDREVQGLITQINGGDRQFIQTTLASLRDMSKVDQSTITTDASEAIQNYYRNEISGYINITRDDYNFPAAEAVLADAETFYAGTLFVAEQRDLINENKTQKITDLYQDFIAALDPAKALQDSTSIDATRSILDIIRRQIDPNHPLLSDPRPANAYRLAAEQAQDQGRLQQALALVESGLATAPGDARLTDLQTTIRQAVRVAELNQSLGRVQGQLASIDDFLPYKDDIIELSNLSSLEQSPVLTALAGSLKTASTNELNRILSGGTRADAEALVEKAGDLLSAMQLGRELLQINLAHLTGAERSAAIQEIVTRDKGIVDQRLAAPNIDDSAWESELLAAVRELDTMQEEDASVGRDLAGYRDVIARLYTDRATQVLGEDRFDAATALVNRGLRFAPDLPALTRTGSQIASRKAAYEKDLRIADLKDQFKVNTDGDNIAKARELYDQLRAEIGANDAYITSDAPAMLGASYARLAQRRVKSGNNEDAFRLAEAGLKLQPGNATLQSLKRDTEVDVYIAELTQLFRTANAADLTDTVSEKKDIIEKSPAAGKYQDFFHDAESALVNRINTLQGSDPDAAGQLAVAAYGMFPSSESLQKLAQDVSAAIKEAQRNLKPGFDALTAGNLSAAGQVIQQYNQYAGQPDYARLQQQLESRMRQAENLYASLPADFAQAKQISARTQRRSALMGIRNNMNKVTSLWNDNADYNKLQDEINIAIASTQAMARDTTDFTEAPKEIAKQWQPVASDRPCNSSLAGHGSRTRAVCYDVINDGGLRGPQLVVIPAGGGDSAPFAIGRFEISVGDWARYCYITGQCQVESNKERYDDPVRGVTIAQVEDYLKWLSERTGKTYRLPTREEWTWAANAEGQQPAKDVNCRVELQGKLLKGTGIADVKSGQANGWGLKNYVGNVREIVTEGGSTLAVGGGFPDRHSDCDISLQSSYDGNADEATGFRVLVEGIN